MNLLELAKKGLWGNDSLSQNSQQSSSRDIATLDDLFSTINHFTFNGLQYPLINQTYTPDIDIDDAFAEGKDNNFSHEYMTHVYRNNGVVFACMLLRMAVFSEVVFKWREETTEGSRLFGNPNLRVLEKPYPSGTTSTLLSRALQDMDIAGNSYHIYNEGELVRLPPEHTFIILTDRMISGKKVGYKKLGYLYYQDGPYSKNEPHFFDYTEVSHFAHIPDPSASWRGMSWLTPIIREIKADIATTEHKLAFFRNGATPNMVVRIDPEFISSVKELKEFYDDMQDNYHGVINAYKTLYLAGAADVEVVGNSFEQMSFKTVQGAGETRICMDAGTPPVLVGASEGLQAATYSNYGQARRRFADGTLHPLWRDVSGAFDTIIPRTTRVTRDNIRLWYDGSEISFLREDEKDISEIMKNESSTVRTLTDAGYEPESIKKFVKTKDVSVLEHTGLFSVQLWPPGHKELEGETGEEVYDDKAKTKAKANSSSNGDGSSESSK